MIDQLWQFAFSNVAIAAGLAVIAWAVQAAGRWPQVAHLLWLLVLARLVTPPVLSFPAFAGVEPFAISFDMLPPQVLPREQALASLGAVGAETPPAGAPAAAAGSVRTMELLLLWIWAAGAALGVIWTLVQFRRFNRHLCHSTAQSPAFLQQAVADIARRMGFKTAPRVCMTTAQVPPMVWGGLRARVVVPEALMRSMTGEQLRGVLAHELAHIRRRDHWVRWLEWLSCVLFWWNPLVWWARRNLRLNEEICCDALAVSATGSRPRRYADALVTAAELLVMARPQPPLAASPMNPGRTLERRLSMILTKSPKPAASRSARHLLLGVALLFPFSGIPAQHEPEAATLHPPEPGAWHAGSRSAQTVTGDLLVRESGIVFERGDGIALAPANPASRSVFAVDPSAVPARLRNQQLCQGTITHVTLLTYNDFALAMHMYDSTEPPPEPTPATVTAVAQRGKCASYYYQATD